MIVAQLVVLLLVTLTCAVGPGLLFVRRWRWGPLETLCVSVGLSLVLVYLATFGTYACGAPRAATWCVTAAAGVTTLACLPDLRRLWRCGQVRRTVLAMAALAGWSFLLLSLVTNYGGGWYGDWYEHYERALFFLDLWPRDATFLDGMYTLPARPPMMNLLAAHLLAHVGGEGGERYALFQVAFLLLNVLVFLPCALAMPMLVRGGRRPVWMLLALLACNPMLVQNTTYSWTRLLCAFYVVLGIWLYVRGWRKRDAGRMMAAVGTLAAGIVVHYSAAPYALLLAAHYLVAVAPRRGARAAAMELAGGLAVAAVVLGPWLAWSAAVYGVRGTFASNTSVTDSAHRTPAENIAKVGRNVVNTFLPHGVRGVRTTPFSRGNTFAGYVRDYWFKIYTANLPLAMGSAGALLVPLVILIQVGAVPRRRDDSPAVPLPPSEADRAVRRFWLWLVPSSILLGIAVHGGEDQWGLAHIGLQPLVYMGLALLAAGLPQLPRVLRWLLPLGVALDFAHGVLLHFAMQRQPLHLPAGDPDMYAKSGLGFMPGLNYELKLTSEVSFWSDHVALPTTVLVAAVGAGGILWLAILIRASWRHRRPSLDRSDPPAQPGVLRPVCADTA